MNTERQFGECVAEMVEKTNELVLEQLGLIAENAKLRAMLKRVEWTAWGGWCLLCDGYETQGHSPDCKLAALLREEG